MNDMHLRPEDVAAVRVRLVTALEMCDQIKEIRTGWVTDQQRERLRVARWHARQAVALMTFLLEHEV